MTSSDEAFGLHGDGPKDLLLCSMTDSLGHLGI